MKKEKVSKIDLIKNLTEEREKLRLLRFKAAGSKGKDVKESKNTRKEIARILTSLNTKEDK